MTRPFMIRFPFGGKGCYANVHVQEAKLREYHVNIIQPDLHTGLPSRIVLIHIENKLHLADPLDFPRSVLKLIVEEIEKQER